MIVISALQIFNVANLSMQSVSLHTHTHLGISQTTSTLKVIGGATHLVNLFGLFIARITLQFCGEEIFDYIPSCWMSDTVEIFLVSEKGIALFWMKAPKIG